MSQKPTNRFSILLAFIIMTLILTTPTLAEDQYQISTELQAPEPEKNANLGNGVAVSGETIIVGASMATSGGIFRSGKVYVFKGDGSLDSIIEPPDPELNSQFGQALAVDGDLVVVGAYRKDIDLKEDAGKAYIFDVSGNLLHELQSPEPAYLGYFGGSVAIDGDYVVIGEESTAYVDAMIPGRAHIFDTDGNHLATLNQTFPVMSTFFGCSVDISGDRVIVGEWASDHAYIFNIDGNLIATLSTPMLYGDFGWSVSIDDDRIVIGEPTANVVHVFDVDGNLLHSIKAPQGHYGSFGFYVALDGDLIAVTEPKGDVDDINDAGYMFLYNIDGDLLASIHSPMPEKDGGFGIGLHGYTRSCASISGDTIVVGEHLADVDGVESAGKAYVIQKGTVSFEISNLRVNPSSVNVGDEVTISVDCTNTGSLSGVNEIVLKIGGEIVEERTVSVDPGDTTSIEFKSTAEEAGSFSIDLNGLTGSYQVSEAKSGIPGFPLETIVLSILLVVGFLLANRSR